jgi:hypothetical protein
MTKRDKLININENFTTVYHPALFSTTVDP